MQVGDVWKVRVYNPVKEKQEILFLSILLCEQTEEEKFVSVNEKAEEAKKQGNLFIK